MAVSITLAEVKEAPIVTGTPDAILLGFIALVDQADNCLDINNVPDDIQRALKLNGVWHIAELSARGGVSSESSPTGASRSYIQGQGFQSTGFGQVLQSLDRDGCLRNAIGAPGNTMFFGSIGRQDVATPRRPISN